MVNAFQFKGKAIEYFLSQCGLHFFYNDQCYKAGHKNKQKKNKLRRPVDEI
jgi:hypothetical protein